MIIVRRAKQEDKKSIWYVHIRAIEEVCKSHYSKEEIQAWTEVLKPARYEEPIRRGPFYVAVEGEIEDETQRAISYIDLLVEKRDELRAKRQWDLADKIRTELGKLGIVLEDTPNGTVWRYRR